MISKIQDVDSTHYDNTKLYPPDDLITFLTLRIIHTIYKYRLHGGVVNRKIPYLGGLQLEISDSEKAESPESALWRGFYVNNETITEGQKKVDKMRSRSQFEVHAGSSTDVEEVNGRTKRSVPQARAL